MSVKEFAEKRLAECINAGDEHDIVYWAAYLDGVKAAERERVNETT